MTKVTLHTLFRAALPAAFALTLAWLTPAIYGRSVPGSGAVFIASNGVDGNNITMLRRAENGRLSLVGHFATGGRGQGGINDPMQSSGSVLLTPDRSYLLAVNAGTSDISVFQVLENGLALLSVTPSGGSDPISITIHDNLVYVLNFAGSSIHTAGFRLQGNGNLQPVKGSRVTLSTLDTEASTIAFSPDGFKLVISERQTNLIDVFDVEPNGSLSNPKFNPSAGVEPFGLTFTEEGTLLVTNASGSLSSYRIESDNSLTSISPVSPASGAATCWVATDGQHAWVTNAVTSSLSSYTVSNGGLNPLGVVVQEPALGPLVYPKFPPTAFPIDLGLSGDYRYLYVLYSARGSVVGYQVTGNGALTQIDEHKVLTPQSGAQGLAAY